MRNYGTPIPLDLLAINSASVTPGTATQTVRLKPSVMKTQIGKDAWPCVRNIGTRTRIGFDQAAAGGTAVNWDELFRMIDSFEFKAPVMGGTLMSKEVFTGPIAKNLVEFFCHRYRYGGDHARAQIASTDGDTAVDLYVKLPFGNDCLLDNAGFWPWVGLLRESTLDVTIATAATIAAVSTGAASEAPCSVAAWFDMFPKNRPSLICLSQWRKYTQVASASVKTMTLENVGADGGAEGVMSGSRLAAVVELMNKLGFGAASTADNYIGFTSDDLGQLSTDNVDAFIASFKDQIGHHGPISGLASGGAVHDGGGNPYTMAAAPNNLLNDSNLAYIPWRFAAIEQRIQNLKKWGVGRPKDLTITRNFTSTPSSGTYIVITNELRQFTPSKEEDIIREMGVQDVAGKIQRDRPFAVPTVIPTQRAD